MGRNVISGFLSGGAEGAICPPPLKMTNVMSMYV